MDGVLRMGKKRGRGSACHEAWRLEGLLGELPGEDEVLKIVSFCEISTLGFIRFIAQRTVIRRLCVSTFRIGPSALRAMEALHSQGRLLDARFIVGKLIAMDERKSSAVEHYERLQAVCRKNGWRLSSRQNHTKLALFDTDAGQFVLEGSSNLNEAPNWEQFSLERDPALYAFYSAALDSMEAEDGGKYGLPQAAGEEEEAWQARESPLDWSFPRGQSI